MGFLIIAVAILALGIILHLISYIFDFEIPIISIAFSIIGGFSTFILLVVILFTHCGIEGTKARKIEEYKALKYKLEYAYKEDNFGLLNKDYLDEIQEWNEDVADGKNSKDNFWRGLFYYPFYDELEFIELPE